MPTGSNLTQFVSFNEAFFNQAVAAAGGCRLSDKFKPPPGKKNVDYLIDGFALELKILEKDTLDAPERQAKLAQFFQDKLPRRPLYVTATKQQVSLRGPLGDEYWERYLGAPIKDRLDTAAAQIADTRTFVPGPLRGAVILVNAAGPSIDWMSFSHLANHYGARFPEIDGILALSAVPVQIDSGYQLHAATIAKEGHRAEMDAVGERLNAAIVALIEKHTGKRCETRDVDPHGKGQALTFTLTPNGVRRKLP